MVAYLMPPARCLVCRTRPTGTPRNGRSM